MKKVNVNGKLSFKKETIAKLNEEQMNFVKGGIGASTDCSAQCASVAYGCGPFNQRTLFVTCPQPHIG